ncbi:hypothetical protein COOONC_26759 [Cooperia oncophora]
MSSFSVEDNEIELLESHNVGDDDIELVAEFAPNFLGVNGFHQQNNHYGYGAVAHGPEEELLEDHETISFDLLPVCFATSRVGSLWAIVYYTAQFLYTSLGPMIIYVSFIYQSFVDDVPTVQNFASLFFALIVTVFAAPSVLLYMPLGTKITTLFRYTSQSSIVQILCYIVIYFVYGWQTIESDILTTTDLSTVSLLQYLIRPTSPIYTVLLFTLVPALLCTKFTAVFDYFSWQHVLNIIDASEPCFILDHSCPGEAHWLR